MVEENIKNYKKYKLEEQMKIIKRLKVGTVFMTEATKLFSKR